MLIFSIVIFCNSYIEKIGAQKSFQVHTVTSHIVYIVQYFGKSLATCVKKWWTFNTACVYNMYSTVLFTCNKPVYAERGCSMD